MRIPVPGLKHAILVAAVALGLGGCVAYPAPGYGYYGSYERPYYHPYYYGPPVVGTVIIGGGGEHHHWR
jgi:hypothetical protein